MNTLVKTSILSISCLLFFAGSALALPSAGQYVKIDTASGLGNAKGGGEFLLDIGTNSTSGFDGTTDYISFCLERTEYINVSSFGTSPTYKIDSVQDVVVGGGATNINGNYTLTNQTQWVYYTYTFTNAFGTHTDDLANIIQEIIWKGEGEITTLSAAAQNFYNSSVSGKVTDEYNPYVTAINILYPNGTSAQSQLIGEQAPVPEPTTMLLFGTGIAGLAGVARRRRVNS